ncbi:molybdopterin-synthase adenylyltransferase MoeB [Endozoicomonas sp. (ex Bugula neritina AB1)]|nr:molybdopterin-synthase adenylyltransferase MoeB [Endozoicomonas sp. (ex Bugula neritina AB1)]
MLSDDQLLRYSRQIMLPQIDISGQGKLHGSRVLILGVGGLGCPAAQYLAAAGVGTMVLVDPDTVDQTNLQRQILFSQDDVGTAKTEAAGKRLKAINPEIELELVQNVLKGDALVAAIRKADAVLDCTDNFISRFAINEACVGTETPLVSGAAIGMNGQLAVYDFRQPNAPCYGCLYDEQSNEQLSCSESGILGPVVGTIGTMQALEAIKLMVGYGKTLNGRLIIFDALMMEWQTMVLQADPDCRVCGKH